VSRKTIIMSTTNSLRALARGEQAYRKHLKARRDVNSNSESSFGESEPTGKKGWTFSKLEYLSRTQLVFEEESSEPSMSEARWTGRDHDKRQQEAKKRELLVLIQQHLKDEGFADAAEILTASMPWDMEQYLVCDNVDLKIILEEYASYHQVKYGKKPDICRRAEKENNEVAAKRKKPQKLMKRSPSVNNNTKQVPLADAGVKDLQITGKGVIEDDLKHSELILPPALMLNDESRELVQWLAKDAVTNNRETSWESVIGHDEAKQALEECVLLPQNFPNIFSSLKNSRMFSNSVSSILLFGPPGTGKTMMAKAVASRFETTFFNVRCSSLASKWRGDSEKLIRVLFQMARHNAPATIFMDEADALLSERGTAQEHEASRRCKAELLVQLDGLESETEGNILFLASTNLPWAIDQAILRRFSKKILVDLPEEEERLYIILSCLFTNVTTPPPIDKLRDIARETAGYSGSDLTQMCREATLAALRAASEDTKLDISMDMLKAARTLVKPSFGDHRKFAEWNRKFGSY
jgi:katanin p60 ATPase-containing subunit A1